jgi:hypothetical protein
MDKITRNRSILHSILKTIYLPVCGKQNITLRGHTEEKSNFIALINYRAETDQILATHLQNSPPNARYLSPTVQNELIDICGRQLQQDIISECNSANCFSVIADETTDVSTTEQIYLCVRYVGVDSDEEMCVKESFLGFAEAIKVITKLPNSEQSYKGKVQTHNYINRQNQSTTENCENRNDPDLVQAFLKKW